MQTLILILLAVLVAINVALSLLLLRLATLRSEDEGFVPGIKSLGVSSFSRYTLLASALFCTVLLLIDTFSFFHFGRLILKIIASTISTLIFIFCAESIGGKK